MNRHPTQKLILSIGFGLLIGLILLNGPSPVSADNPAPAFVTITTDNYADLQAVRRQVERAGGQVKHIFPPDSFVAHLTPTQAQQVRALHQVAAVTFDPVPSLSTVDTGLQAQSMAAIWNSVFHNPRLQPQPPQPFADAVIIPSNHLPMSRSVQTTPYGAEYGDTSAYLMGDVVVALVLPESNGAVDDSTQDWTAAEVLEVQSSTVAGLDKWVQAEPNANLTFIYVWANEPPPGGVNNTVESDYEAEKYINNFEPNVINSFMARLGYTNFYYLTNIYDYLNDLRTTYDADWAYLVQVRDDERTVENNCGMAGSMYHGPTLTLYDCDLRNGYTVAHETGHVFGAKDEYCPGACLNPIDRHGYLQTVNANSAGPFSGGLGFFGGKGEGLDSIMNNTTFNIHPYTRGQVGWRDGDGDGILDVRDTYPNTSLGTSVAGSRVVINGQATVVPWRGNGKDISLNVITGVEVRLNGLTWLPTLPADGAFDEPDEAFTLTLPTLPDGTYTLEARGQNDVGNIERSYAKTTFIVNGSTVANAAPLAVLQITPQRASTATTFTVDAGASADLEGQAIQARWDWENNGSWDTGWSTSLVATHNYAAPGVKVIALQLKDSQGDSVIMTRSVEVTGANTLPHPFFVVNNGDSRFGSATPTFTFDASGSNDGETPSANLQFRWDFNGDSIFDTGWVTTPVANHVYAFTAQGQSDGLPRSNHWSVVLEVKDGDGETAVTTRHIWGNPYNHAPIVNGIFSSNIGNTTSPIPLDFSLTSDTDSNTSWDGLLEYQFDWDSDGNWDTDFSPAGAWSSYKLTEPGDYLVTMQVRDRYGATALASEPLTITGPASPVAGFSATPTSGIAPLNVTFTNSSIGNYTTCSWNFGDGSTSSTCNPPAHSYTATGTYSVSLTISGSGGSNTQTRTNYITVSASMPMPDFTASLLAGRAPLTVVFTNSSTGSINSWLWDFGDGSTSTLENPTHTYSIKGTFTVTLTATGPGGSQTKVMASYIRVSDTPVIANFSAQPTTGSGPLTVQFSDESTGNINAWLWDFGDGTFGNTQDPIHSYLLAGNYTVILTTSGPEGNDTFTKTNYISVYENVFLPVVITTPNG